MQTITLQRAIAEVAEAYYVSGLDIDEAVVKSVPGGSIEEPAYVVVPEGCMYSLRAVLVDARRLWVETAFRRRHSIVRELFSGYVAIIGDDGGMPTSASIVAVDEFTGSATTVLRIYPSEEKVEPWGG